MERVKLNEAKPRLGTASVANTISDSIGIDGFAMNFYVLEPGERFSTSYHTHLDQEEVFTVLEGTATFRTEEGSIEVGPDEVVRFAPGEWQHGYNDTDDRVVGLVIGVPRGGTDARVECPDCGARAKPDIEMVEDGQARIFRCGECGAQVAEQRLSWADVDRSPADR